MKTITLKIGGQDVNVTVRKPSLMNRTQFTAIISEQYGLDKGLAKKIKSTFIYEANEEELKTYLKAATDISFARKEALRLDEGENYNKAVEAVLSFFLTLGKTIKK